MNSLIEKIISVFPDFYDDIKDLDIETQKASVFKDFYYRYLIEFEVDVENIKKVQLAQQITEEEEMTLISSINFFNSINLLIPYHSLGLFDLIVPCPSYMSSKVNCAIKFLDFSDTTLNSIYGISNPFTEAKIRIKMLSQEIFDKKSLTKDVISLKFPHKVKIIAEVEAKCKSGNDALNEEINVRRALEQNIDKIAQNDMLMRKSQQSENTLKNIKEKLELQKLKLDRSVNCDEKLIKMEQQLAENHNEIQKTKVQTEMYIKSQVVLSEVKDILAARTSSVKKITEALSTQIQLAEAIKQKEAQVKEKGGASSLEEIDKNTVAKQKETEKLLRSHLQERKRLENAIERNREYGSNKVKLLNLKLKFRDVIPAQRKIHELDNKISKTYSSFLHEENKLKQMEDNIKNRMTSAHYYKDMSSSTVEIMKKINDKDRKL